VLRSNEALHERVRRWLVSGALFLAPQAPQPRMGRGARCAVCSAPIPNGELESGVLSAGGATMSTHRRCYLIWRQESQMGGDARCR
jgi:hypothetical protein